MLKLKNNEVIYNNSINLGNTAGLNYTGAGFSITLPDSVVFIPEEDCTPDELAVFAAYKEAHRNDPAPPPPTREQLLVPIRAQRDTLLVECDFVVQRHTEQKELVKLGKMQAASLTDVQYNSWLEYRQKLRDLPQTVDVNDPVYPAKP